MNHDEIPDWVGTFPVRDAGLPEDATKACVRGRSTTGVDFDGCDTLLIGRPVVPAR